MPESAEALERRIDRLRADVRRAVTRGDRERAGRLRGQLRDAERAWDDALADLAEDANRAPPARWPTPLTLPALPAQRADEAAGGRLLPLREQVHQALLLLGVPAAPRLTIAVHEAFSAGRLAPARLTSLRRDEERSFRSAPHARPYYLCPALTADLLAPARGLLAVSTWSMATRIIGPLSPRVDFLIGAARLAEAIARAPDPRPAALRLLWRFAVNIPGAATSAEAMRPAAVVAAAKAELEIHSETDRSHREATALRAGAQLDDAEQLFGTRLRTLRGTGT